MGRFGIFVDAGFLIAGAGAKCFGIHTRPQIEVGYESLCSALVDLGRELTGLEHLRTYWYDGATDRVPTATHLAVAKLSGVKLRLGRLTAQGQKGVDSLIVRDLITLASRRSINTGILVGGDDDLTEGLREAQDFGVRMIVLGMESGQTNVSRSLANEADHVQMLEVEFLAPHFSERPDPSTFTYGSDPRDVGAGYASDWLSAATPADVQRLCSEFPWIPRELDRELLAEGRRTVARELSSDQLRLLRDAFKEGIQQDTDESAETL